jgi:TonB family protein
MIKTIGAVLGAMMLIATGGAAFAQDDDCVAAEDATLTPVSRDHAGYPEDAYNEHIEGYVVVSFDVTREGAVENLRIVDSSPRGVFEAGVIRSVRDWRYEPPTDYYGNVVRVCGKRQRFDYTLDQ